MKLTGAMLLLGACILCGCRAASRLDRQVRCLRTLMQLIDTMMTELQSRLPFLSELLPLLADKPAFAGLPFLQEAARNTDTFPESWNAAVETDSTLTDEARSVLITVGQTLGSTTLEGQISALRLCEKQLLELYGQAAERARQKGTLCRSMGLLSGMFLVILLL